MADSPASASEIRAGKAFVEITLKDAGYVNGLERARKRLERFGVAIRKVGALVRKANPFASLTSAAEGSANAIPQINVPQLPRGRVDGVAEADREIASLSRSLASLASARPLAGLTDRFAAIAAAATLAGDAVKSIGVQIVGVGTIFTGFFGGATLAAVSMGSELVDLSARTGVAIEKLAALGYAAEQGGADLDILENGFKGMQKTIGLAATTSAKGADELARIGVSANDLQAVASGARSAHSALARLGISVEELQGLSPDQQFAVIADRIAAIEDPAIRLATAMKVFGAEAGQKLLPLLAGGSKGLAEMEVRAKELGLVMSTEAAEAAEALGDDIDTMWRALKGASVNIGSSLVPIIADLVAQATDAAASASAWVKENGGLVVSVAKLSVVAVAAGGVLIGLGTAMSIGGMLAASLATAIGLVASPLGLLVIAAGTAATAFARLTTVGQSLRAQFLSGLGVIVEDTKKAFGGISDALAAGNIQLAAQILWAELTLQWQKGINAIMQQWRAWRDAFIDVIDSAWGYLEEFGASTAAAFAKAWLIAIDSVREGLEIVGGSRERDNIVYEGSQFPQQSSSPVPGSAFQGIRDPEAGTQRGSGLQDKLAGIDDALGRERAGVDQGARRRAAEREKERSKADQEAAAALARISAEVDALIKQAQELKETQKQEAIDRLPKIGAPGSPEAQEDVIGEVERRFSIRGTFNANAVRGLAIGSDPAERTAKATEELVRIERKVLGEIKTGGVVFV